MAKARGDGHYTTTDETGRVHRFKVRKGDTLPDDAEFVSGDADDAEAPPEEPKPKAKQAERGPSETTAAAGPAEKG